MQKTGGVANLFTLLRLFKLDKEYNKFEQDYKTKKIRYAELKEVLALGIFKELQPFQAKRKIFKEDSKLVDGIINESNRKCLQIAEETMKEVRGEMGVA